jgi:hypothetical protein
MVDPTPPVKWRWWKVIRAGDQNISADIELARAELSKLAHLSLSAENKAVMTTCNEMLNSCIESQKRLFANRVFIRQERMTGFFRGLAGGVYSSEEASAAI